MMYLVNYPYNIMKIGLLILLFIYKMSTMESCSSLHNDVAEANTNVTPSLDEQGSIGEKQSHITQSSIMQYFKLMHDRTYSC